MFDYQNSEDLQELREYIENIQAENQELREALEFIRDEPHLSCRGEYCEKDDCDSYAFCSHIVAKEALNKTSL